MHRFGLLLTTVALALSLAAAAPAPAGQVDALVGSLRKATFNSEKDPIARKLAALGTPEARAALMSLLADGSRWNQDAAVVGLFAWKDASTGDALCTAMLDEFMLRDGIARGFAKDLPRFLPTLSARYRAAEEEGPRHKILDAINGSPAPEAPSFLKKIVEDPAAPDRLYAFGKLTTRPDVELAYVRRFAAEPDLREPALACVAARGTAADLPLFAGLLGSKEEPKLQLIALDALKRLGSPAQKTEACLVALRGTEPLLARAALELFQDLPEPAVKAEWRRLARRSPDLETRLSAAAVIGQRDPDHAVAYLIPVLRERFVPPSSTLMSTLLSPFTLGLTTLTDYLGRRADQKWFDRSQRAAVERLKALTGQELGAAYEPWLEWAVLDGRTVDGQNLLQRLFSPNPAARARALAAAAKLLGAPGLAGKADLDSRLAAARLLEQKGFLRDEE